MSDGFKINNPIPLMSEDLINELDKNYPRQAHQPGTNLDRLWFDNGKRDLIEELIERLGSTNYAKLKGDITVNV